ncbi:hypothetical protein MO867_11360 [Microbulbifer sp. OS29]|uniref:Uncharacterized protein n=1 Tax=Microbulbifer okhotskensis TaxID=2926617 RepID=A0A9X2J7W7_9GAMM|nr:hypothetical protein [Microbulbifer okhotskensis]MCO1334936.1 hypothetical protein [Microbulbifer okhotskensis]
MLDRFYLMGTQKSAVSFFSKTMLLTAAVLAALQLYFFIGETSQRDMQAFWLISALIGSFVFMLWLFFFIAHLIQRKVALFLYLPNGHKISLLLNMNTEQYLVFDAAAVMDFELAQGTTNLVLKFGEDNQTVTDLRHFAYHQRQELQTFFQKLIDYNQVQGYRELEGIDLQGGLAGWM